MLLKLVVVAGWRVSGEVGEGEWRDGRWRIGEWGQNKKKYITYK